MLIKLLVEIVIGGLCGYAANRIMKGKSDDIIANVLLGLVGGVVGGLIGNLLNVGGGWLTGIALCIAGSCLVIWIWRKIRK
ncbi:MAG: GlsB/YeaQ/YmgE family stress response membrane protein [Oscillospiraceae bacterium]|nr:GlsB/YeaQ/YmgE family stress response membrane protein [Oscillospiraceae bacterium]